MKPNITDAATHGAIEYQMRKKACVAAREGFSADVDSDG